MERRDGIKRYLGANLAGSGMGQKGTGQGRYSASGLSSWVETVHKL